MNTNKMSRPLDGWLYGLLLAEFLTFVIYYFCPTKFWTPEEDSQFTHVWHGLWWILAAYWFVSLILAAVCHRLSHLHYGVSWLLFFTYSFLGRHDPMQETAFGELFGGMNTFLGGICAALLCFRATDTGAWTHQTAGSFLRLLFQITSPSHSQPTTKT
jgi:hypothetical protein